MKIIFSTYQIIQSITVTLDVLFPPIFSSMLSFLSFGFFNLDVASLACSKWGDVYSAVLITSAAPLVAAMLVVAPCVSWLAFRMATAFR